MSVARRAGQGAAPEALVGLSHLRASQAVQVGIQWTKGLRVAQFPYCDSLQTMVPYCVSPA